MSQHTSRNTRPYTAMSSLHYNATTAYHPGGAFLPDGDATDPLPQLHQQAARSSSAYGAVGPSQLPLRDRMYSVPDMASYFGGAGGFGSDDDVFAHVPPPRSTDYPSANATVLPPHLTSYPPPQQQQTRPLPIHYAPTPTTASNAHPPPFGHGHMTSPQHISPALYAPPMLVQRPGPEASGSRPGTAQRPDTAASNWSMASDATIRPRTRGGDADEDEAS